LSRLSGSRSDHFQALYEENYHRVLGYALRRVGAADAGDVVAETFLVAWRRLEEVPTGSASRLWLYGTARHVVANQRRGTLRRQRLIERVRAERADQAQPASPTPELNRAALAFARLRPEEREVLALVAWEGLNAGEVAQVLGCSRNAARIRVHRARRRFARELDRVHDAVKQNPAGGHVSEAYE
jgi:RNA polymerase sigma factor (sigma-70 family)